MFEIEQNFECPYCGEQVSVLLDPTAGGQEYTEDCEVCCRPFVLRFEAEEETISSFSVQRQ